jgi:hypothetical protein
MSIITQNAPKSLQGPGAERPNALTLPDTGTIWLSWENDTFSFLKNENGARSWVDITGGGGLTILTDPVFYVDPVNGNDGGSGTISSPFETINHALNELSPGWYGTATINLRAGTSTIANRLSLPSPLGNTITTTGSLLFNGVDNTDSGLGSRTSAGGTTGTLNVSADPVMGTLIDSVGGLGVNTYRGSFIRFTSGATLNGKSFLIAKNSATTFTISGVFPVAPTTETFVVETPAAVITWVGAAGWFGSVQWGLQNIAISGPGGSTLLEIHGLQVNFQRCSIANIGVEILLREGASFSDLSTVLALFGTLTISQRCGVYFNGVTLVFNPLTFMNMSECLFRDSPCEILGPCGWQVGKSYYVGNSYVRGMYGAFFVLIQSILDTVTPAPTSILIVVGADGAAIVASKNSTLVLSNVIISDTPSTTSPGDAVLLQDGSEATLSRVTGSGNAGLGCRVNIRCDFRRNTSTAVTGTLGDVKLGDAAVQPWSDFAVINTDLVQLCIGGPH